MSCTGPPGGATTRPAPSWRISCAGNADYKCDCSTQKPSDKSSPPGQAAQQQADHADIDHGLAAGAEQLVLLTEPAGVGRPGEGALDDPPSRQHAEAGWREVFGPVDLVVRQILEDPDLLVAGGCATISALQPSVR